VRLSIFNLKGGREDEIVFPKIIKREWGGEKGRWTSRGKLLGGFFPPTNTESDVKKKMLHDLVKDRREKKGEGI